ncbi:MAG TPA: class I SAM-dependent methyltransferase, partial [Phenylobacterium sp.]
MPATDAAFAGSIPEIYHRRLGPVLFEPFAADLGARLLGQAGAILELACGTGIVTRALALMTPAPIVATDLN